MAKRPQPGAVKTRLCPPLSNEQASALAEALLEDTVALVRRAACAELLIACSPATEQAWFADRFPGVGLIPQIGDDLGARLAAVFAAAWKLRFRPCVVIGTDCPYLTPEILNAAFEALKPGQSGAEVALGPAQDGGYYLIGSNWPQPALFQDVDWSSDRVLAQTLAHAHRLRLPVRLLPRLSDIDLPTDLVRLRGAALSEPSPAFGAVAALLRTPGLSL